MKKFGILVAPVSDVSWSQEIGKVSSIAPFAVLTGHVDLARVKSTLWDTRGASVFHWAGHAATSGLVLSDDKIWHIDDIVFTLKQFDFQLVFLNACDSHLLANRLAFDADIPIVIHGAGDLNDSTALSVARSIYMQVVAGKDVYDSYAGSRPDDGTMSIIVGPSYRHKKRRYLVWGVYLAIGLSLISIALSILI